MQSLVKQTLALLALITVLAPTLVSGQTPPAEGSGTLDASFGTGGLVTTDFGGFNTAARAVAVQPDGKIVAAGVAAVNGIADIAVARYNRDGTLDASFGTGGTVITDFAARFNALLALPSALARQPDGKIVVAGVALFDVFANFAMARYNSDGTLDESFGTGGIVTTSFGDLGAQAFAVAVQADGRIVAAGIANIDGREDFALVRYNRDGTLDASFGTDGKVTTAFDGFPGEGFTSSQAVSVAVQPDGRIVAAGNAFIGEGFDTALARYNSNGTLDAGFGTGGRVTTDFGGFNDLVSVVAVEPDGRIVAVGQAGPFSGRDVDFALARYNSDGTLDAGFGTGGKATTDFAGSSDQPFSVALQGDGKIVVAGRTLVGDAFDFGVARYNSDGTLDAGFGTSGTATTDFAGFDDQPASVAVQPDGNIVVAGVADLGGRRNFALARYVGGAAQLEPDIDTAPASLAFGNVRRRTFRNLGLTVRNTGTATLNVTSTTLLGPDAAQYSIVAGGGTFSLEPGATRLVVVRFAPTSLGVKVATLRLVSNDPDENAKEVPLSGRGRLR